LFANTVFLLNRETPIYCLQYLILSFGGMAITDEESEGTKNYKITHHVMDRPLVGKINN